MTNPEIQDDYYGKWVDILARPKKGNQQQRHRHQSTSENPETGESNQIAGQELQPD